MDPTGSDPVTAVAIGARAGIRSRASSRLAGAACAILAAVALTAAPARPSPAQAPPPTEPAPGPRSTPVDQGSEIDEGPEPTGPLVAPGPKPDLVLLYTGGVIGYIEPCGCPRNPAGGLARRAGYRALLEESYPGTPILLLDTGDFSGSQDEAGRFKTENLHRGMSRLGLSVSNVGVRELAGGLGAFLEQAGDATVLFTNATFVYRDTGEPVFAPFAIREVATGPRSVKIGFIGINAYDPGLVLESGGGRVVTSRDPVSALESLVPMVRRHADLVVVLANIPARGATTVLEHVRGIDLLLASDGPRLSPGGVLERVEGVPVFYSGDQGKRIGEVRAFLEPGGVRFEGDHVWLTRRYPAEPGIQTLIDGTLARVNEMYREMAERGPLQPGATSYLTAAACKECHASEHAIWSESRHAHAFQTLVAARQEFNPECVTCHVTGFGSGGFVNARQTPVLANVQCEACHGDATGHPESPEKAYGDVPPRTCFRCHTEENSPDFVFFPYWEKIRH